MLRVALRAFPCQGLRISVHEASVRARGGRRRDLCRRRPTRGTVSPACPDQDWSHVPCQEEGEWLFSRWCLWAAGKRSDEAGRTVQSAWAALINKRFHHEDLNGEMTFVVKCCMWSCPDIHYLLINLDNRVLTGVLCVSVFSVFIYCK